MKNNLSGEALYYPSIEFTDIRWLKRAIYLYDKIHRIVPGGYVPRDSDFVLKLIDAGIVNNLTPSKPSMKKTAAKFKKVIENDPLKPAGLVGSAEYEYARLHPEKVDVKFRSVISELSTKVDGNGFYNLSAELVNGYMLYLAREISRENRLDQITDFSDMFPIMEYFTAQGKIDDVFSGEYGAGCIALTLPYMIPNGIDDLEHSKLIGIRESLLESRIKFREEVSSKIPHISDSDSPKLYKDTIDSLARELLKNCDNLRKTSKPLFSDLIYTGITVGVPVFTGAFSIPGISSVGNGWISSVVLGLSVSAVTAIKEYKNKRSKSGLNYILELRDYIKADSEFKPQTIRYDRLLNEFVND